MKRKIIYLILVFIFAIAFTLLTTSEANAAIVEIDGINYETDGTTAAVDGVTSNLPSNGEVIIPETIVINTNDSYTVTSIDMQAFKDCGSLINITIPKSVTSIGNYAFERCRNLKEVKILDNSLLTSIGQNAFDECNSLESITLPNSLTSIGSGAFKKCTSLESITIPNSINLINNYTLEYCYNLKNVTIPESVTVIGEKAFNGCNSLESITIPKSVTSIGFQAFIDCSSLKSVIIPDDSLLNSIGISAFNGCNSLENITIPKSVTSIGVFAFHDCASVKMEYAENFTNVLNNTNPYLTYSNENFTTKLIPIGEYKLVKNNIIVKTGGVKLDSSKYSYDEENAILTIPEIEIKGNVEITAVAKNAYKLTINNVEGITITPNGVIENVIEGSKIDIKIKANTGYRITSIKVNGIEQALPITNDILTLNNISEDTTVIVEGEKTNNNEQIGSIDSNSNINSQEKTSNNPRTGDNILFFVGLLAVSIIGIIFTIKLRKI